MVRAFSLMELLVVVGIFVLITGVVLANHNKYNTSVLLGNTAYSIALSIRQAQVYGLSTQRYNTTFQVGYGLHFTSPTSYEFYADLNRDKKWDASDQVIQTYTLGRGHTILRFCGYDVQNNASCSDADVIDHLDVSFLRPEPDATISSGAALPYSRGTIVVQSSGGETRTVTVASTGQISVSNP